jgi:hypothetical protein
MYPPVKRAVTLGRAGELIAESVFEQNFYKTCRVNHEGFDLLIFDDEGDSYRVEVKTASTSAGKAGHRYKFMTSKGSGAKASYTEKDTDLMVFVALDIRRIVVKCVTNVTRKRTTLRADEFDKCEATQIRQAIEEVRKRRC